jgi:plastocyanin
MVRISEPKKAYSVVFTPTIQQYRIGEGRAQPFCRLVRSNLGVVASAILLAYVPRSNSQGEQAKATEFAAPRGTRTEVVIDHHRFSPNSVTIAIGATVTWTNRDSAPHTVTSSGGEFNESPVLKQGQTFSNTFTTAGSFSYSCSIHPQMMGKIIVK